MYNKGLRIPLLVIGSLLFIFKNMFAGYEMNMIIPISNHGVGFALSTISIILIIIGIFGFRKKPKDDEIKELKDRVQKLEEEKSKSDDNPENS